MSLLGEIVRDVIALLLVGAFLEMLLPDGALAKFARLALGLLLLTLIVQPISQAVVGDAPALDLRQWTEAQPAAGQAYVEQGEELAQYLQGEAYGQYVSELSRQIEAVVLLDERVSQATAQPELDLSSGRLTGLTVLICPAEGCTPDKEKLVQGLSGFFAIEQQHIMIQEVQKNGGEQGAAGGATGGSDATVSQEQAG